MRNLTVFRKKSFVGSLMKDQVYIRDAANPELTIAGVPCRKVGTVKNGGKLTISAGEEEQQIFLIADKVSKDYCYGTATVPAGTEDAELSGKHKFVLGSNPFVFEGVEQTPEEQTQQKKNNRKGIAIFIAAILVGGLLGVAVSGGLFDSTAAYKRFTEQDFQITLAEDFSQTQLSDFFAVYESKTAVAFVLREEKELFEGYTLDDYADLILEVNQRTDLAKHSAGDYIWFEYNDTPDGQELYYRAACYESQEAFWVVSIATPAGNKEKYSDRIGDWLDSVVVGNQ